MWWLVDLVLVLISLAVLVAVGLSVFGRARRVLREVRWVREQAPTAPERPVRR